jgi:hypothetical protein
VIVTGLAITGQDVVPMAGLGLGLGLVVAGTVLMVAVRRRAAAR